MTPLTALFIYVLIWWVMLFTVLPFGVRRHEEHGRGYDAGAPEKHSVLKKMLVNSVVSAVVLGIIQILVVKGVIDWHGLFANAWK